MCAEREGKAGVVMSMCLRRKCVWSDHRWAVRVCSPVRRPVQ